MFNKCQFIQIPLVKSFQPFVQNPQQWEINGDTEVEVKERLM